MHNLEKKFPSYFKNFELPKDARDQEIIVYRACRTLKLEKESFLPTFEENNYMIPCGFDMSNPMVYSLSTFEKPKDVKRFATTNNKFGKPFKIAKGTTDPTCGPSQISRERVPEMKKSSHVDWWIYENACPWQKFEMIDDFDAFLLDYRK